ncbi:uncharacterized protein LOC131028792 [Cryptomeria japonica]|uniref:uncharacterized protein LOC131028792 n=1 Tax=Cryptomeria japonica TaxID=3369 RepID=UPI0025AD9051|nr:uncharacterized protein LOC131028792 [Cryptomeria japonica]
MGCLSKKMAYLGLVLIMLHMTPCTCSSRKLKGMVQQSPLTTVFTMPAKMNSFAAVQKSTPKTSKSHFLKGWIETWPSTIHPRLFLHEVHTGPNPISNSFPWAKRKPIPQSP